MVYTKSRAHTFDWCGFGSFHSFLDKNPAFDFGGFLQTLAAFYTGLHNLNSFCALLHFVTNLCFAEEAYKLL